MKLLFCVILTLFAFCSLAQKVSLNFIETLFHQSFETANDKIIVNGYSFSQSYKIDDSESIAYVYDNNNIKDEYATYSLTLEITEKDICNQILFQTYSKADFMDYKDQIKRRGYKLIKNSRELNKIIFTYYHEVKDVYCEITQDLAENVNHQVKNRYLIRIM